VSDRPRDPLLGLLTDIANELAGLVERLDAMEARIAAEQGQTNEALVTIAEIAARTYYAAKPTAALPDDVINAGVMNAIIDHWPQGAIIGWSHADRELLNNLGKLDTRRIETLISQANANSDQSNACRLRREASLSLLNQEVEKRVKARQSDVLQNVPGRER
jgi:hypothetical protein